LLLFLQKKKILASFEEDLFDDQGQEHYNDGHHNDR
jgi:hypothetical protein